MSETSTETKNKLSSNQLALIRTGLANERTYLAFVRSGFAAIGLGLKLETLYPVIVGLGFVIAGMYEYYKVKFVLRRAGSEALGDNLIMEIVVFASLAILYWVFKKRKK
jgi:uncharacterized membrane protein YidH (DUF202 family)